MKNNKIIMGIGVIDGNYFKNRVFIAFLSILRVFLRVYHSHRKRARILSFPEIGARID